VGGGDDPNEVRRKFEIEEQPANTHTHIRLQPSSATKDAKSFDVCMPNSVALLWAVTMISAMVKELPVSEVDKQRHAKSCLSGQHSGDAMPLCMRQKARLSAVGWQ
jgi:hypothetical protein